MYARKQHQQRGQALIETCVVAIALLPLLLLAIYLGKLQSIQQSTIGASRALAFECHANFDACNNLPSNLALADEVRRRFFMTPSNGIVSNDAADNGASSESTQPLWTDRRGNALLEAYADVGFRVDTDTFNAGSGVAGSTGARIASNAMDLLSRIAGPGRFGLDWQSGLIDAKVQTRLSQSADANGLVESLNPIPISLRAHTATLTDAWNASSARGGDARSTQTRADQGSRIPGLEEAIDVMYAPTRLFIALGDISIIEPRSREFSYHEQDVGVIPTDRRP